MTFKLLKNKSVKYYLNELPVEIIQKINEKIPSNKKYKHIIKNKKKIHNQIRQYKEHTMYKTNTYSYKYISFTRNYIKYEIQYFYDFNLRKLQTYSQKIY